MADSSASPGLPSRKTVAIVIPTLGDNDCLEETLLSIHAQLELVRCVVVVDQSESTRIGDICRSAPPGLPVIHARSRRGVSHARNVGLALVPPEATVVAFTDDDCTYVDGCFAKALSQLRNEDVGAVTGCVLNFVPRNRYGNRTRTLNRRTVWTNAEEAALFFRRSVLREVGDFDESLGLGSATPWQSGEGTDLLLRIMRAGHQVVYEPLCRVQEHESHKSQSIDWPTKNRLYGRGTGRVYQKHYAWPSRITTVVRPVLAAMLAALRRDPVKSRLRLQSALGRWEGIVGKVKR